MSYIRRGRQPTTMASEAAIVASLRRHVSRPVTLCDTDGLTCRDCVCACCAGQCIAGLLWQLSEPGGNVDRAGSGGCGRMFYYPSCYPCVVTDGCCVYAAIESAAPDNPDIGNALEAAARIRVRDRLKARAGDTAGGLSESILQVCCAPCYCTPCRNAAVARELRPPGYGGLWCPAATTVIQYALL